MTLPMLETAVPDLTIVVVASRPAPQGSKKYAGHRVNRKTGKSTAVLVEESKRVAPWRQQVAAAARARAGESWVPLDGPLRVEVVFTARKPVSAPKTRRTWPCTRDSGDIDKLLRSTFDALADDAKVIKDDSRIVQVTAAKVFPHEGIDALSEPGAVIRIWRLA